MSGNNKDTTALILAAMDDLGPADARTIAEKADVGYSTAVRKLRDWSTNGEIAKIDRGIEPAHFALLPTDQPLPEHLQPAHLPTSTGKLFDDPQDGPAADERDCEDADQPHQPDGDGQETADSEPAADIETQAEEDTTGAADDTAVLPDPDALATPVEDVASGAQDQEELPADADEQAQADAAVYHIEDAADEAPLADDTASGGEEAHEAPASVDADNAPQPTPDATVREGKAPRRPKTYFHTESMAILRANPDTVYTVGDVAKLILAKEINGGAPATTKVSSGAISNALFKAAGAGECLVVQEKNPAKFQAA